MRVHISVIIIIIFFFFFFFFFHALFNFQPTFSITSGFILIQSLCIFLQNEYYILSREGVS